MPKSCCIFVYKLIYVDHQFRKPFKSYLGQHAVHKLIINMVEESKYYSFMMKSILKDKIMKNLRALENAGFLITLLL